MFISEPAKHSAFEILKEEQEGKKIYGMLCISTYFNCYVIYF